VVAGADGSDETLDNADLMRMAGLLFSLFQTDLARLEAIGSDREIVSAHC
jgi:hypothetical protein